MYKIAIGNEKGGVGKTTLSNHIAAGLACRGGRVLLVDTDPQGHSSWMWGLAKEAGLYNLLVRDAAFAEVVRDVPPEKYGIPGEVLPKGRLSVLPSNVETRNIANSISDVWKVGARLEEIAGAYDVVIFDMSPTPSLLHGTVLLATDGVIYPTQTEMLSFDGLVEAWQHRKQAEPYRATQQKGQIRVLGIVPVRVRKQTLDHQSNLAKLVENFGDLVWPAIPDSIIWSESTTYRQPVYQLDPAHDAAGHVWELVDRVEEAIRGSKESRRAS